ncbi:MAG TPA: FG-GAP-like repeat-containing protein [Usitatibacter sp.]|jgi:DNA-binding beta-propeller fold protein YncE|nr:FG-GAP-like repeat-containing protein [Usitatibacter sp.]
MRLRTCLAALFIAATPLSEAQTLSTTLTTGSGTGGVAIDITTNKIYVVNEFDDNISEIDGVTNAFTQIALGTGVRPQHVEVNPVTHKIYVNGGDANVYVIDEATHAVVALPVGSTGPMAIDPVTNKIYIVRQSTAATDEVSVLDGATNTWFTWGTDSFQPNELSLDPLRNIVYVSHYATGSVAAIPGDSTEDQPHPPTINVWTKPMALVVNPVTNLIYVINNDSRGPINILDGANFQPNTGTSLAPAGHAVGARVIAVNTVTNKIYAAFDNEIIKIDGATNALTFIPVGSTPGSGAQAIAINTFTNKVYASLDDGSVAVIDGDSNAVTTLAGPAGPPLYIGVNPITNKVYAVGADVYVINGAEGISSVPMPLTTSISTLAGDTSGPNASFTFTASSTFSPTATAVRTVYYQLDSTLGAWTAANGAGPFTATTSALPAGPHTIHAFAADSQESPTIMNETSASPLIGTIASYSFTVVAGTRKVASDFDGDGKSDIAWSNADGRAAVWLMNGLAPSSSAEILGASTGWSVARVADLDGDGKADIVWQNTDGRVAIYLMNGTAPATSQQILNAGAWSVAGAADLDGDGKADLLFQNADGSVAAWTMDGATVKAGATLVGPGSGWSVAATADFDGDGKSDIAWQNTDGRVSLWLMDGLTVKASSKILDAGSAWSLTAAADLDGDGKADIVWTNADGSVAAWLMDGLATKSGATIVGPGTGWSVTRTGDFDGDGDADIVFTHTDGSVAIYLMNGLVPATTTQILNAGSGWSVKRIADVNGDGKSDIVWQHSDGRAAIWLMDGATMASGSEILAAGGGWSVIDIAR